MAILKEFKADRLLVKVFSDRAEMGIVSASEAAEYLKRLLAEQEEIGVIFAAAPSQNEFLAALISDSEIDWTRVNAFHMDEYIGLDPVHPAGFRNFLRERVFSRAAFKTVNYLNGNASDPKAEAARYGKLLDDNSPEVCLMGIGENGHIAFNDPPTADFNDKAKVKIVKLDEHCRMQQVNDGCFETIGQVPTHALTVTIPGLMAAKALFCMVPAPTKADAVCDAINGPVSTSCPASILRTHENARLYLDADAGRYIL